MRNETNSCFSKFINDITLSYLAIAMYLYWGFRSGSVVKNPPANGERQERQVPFLGQYDPLEKEMATHSSILALKILWTEEPGRLQSMGSQSQTQLSD